MTYQSEPPELVASLETNRGGSGGPRWFPKRPFWLPSRQNGGLGNPVGSKSTASIWLDVALEAKAKAPEAADNNAGFIFSYTMRIGIT